MSQFREQERAQLLPTKEALTALKSDVTLESAVLELCDNALDAWQRASGRSDAATIHISTETDGAQTQLLIRDDTGGVPRQEAAMLFGLGRTAKHNDGSIGTFGVGAKKSLVNLGVPFSLRSRHETEDDGWRYEIDEAWFEDDEDWSVPLHTDPDIPPGVTEIRIIDLNYQWDSATAESLRQRLGKAYNLFLSDEMQALSGDEFNLTIIVDNEPVTPQGTPDWSYSPFDGMIPRRYENIELQFESLSAPVFVDITVGLLRKKDAASAGTDVYIQKRKVVDSARGEAGGFGDGQDRLGTFSARHERLRIIIEIETTADGQRLPWDTQKSSIDQHNLIMRGTEDTKGIYNWLRRAAQAYFTLDADQVPKAFLEPYGADASVAANDGSIMSYDYTDRQRIITNHRPDTNLPEVAALRQMAEGHATLHIRCDESIADWKLPAYRIQLDHESDRDIEQLTHIETAPPEDVEKNAHHEAGLINELARIHLQHAIRYPSKLESWQQPRYAEYLNNRGGGRLATVNSLPDDIPGTPGALADEEHAPGDDSPVAESSQTVPESQGQQESAEVFLLFTDENDERGSKLLDLPRSQLCGKLGLPHNAGDDIVWEELRHNLEDALR